MNPRRRKQISVLSVCPGTFVQEFERHTHTQRHLCGQSVLRYNIAVMVSPHRALALHNVTSTLTATARCHTAYRAVSEAQAHLMISFPSLTGDAFLPCLRPRGPGMERVICIFLLLLLHGQKASPANVQLLLSREPGRILHFSGADNAGKQSWREGLSPAQAEPREWQLPWPGTAQKGPRVSTQSWHLQGPRLQGQKLEGALQCCSPGLCSLHLVLGSLKLAPWVWGTGFGNRNDTMAFAISWLSCWLSFYTNN